MQHNEAINSDGLGQIGDFYISPNGVEFCWLSEGLITVSASYTGELRDGDEDLEYSYIGIAPDFEKIFGIDLSNEQKAASKINSITREQLEAMYHKGLADVACSVYMDDDIYSLYFSINPAGMKAFDDTYDVLLEVPAVLEEPSAFIGYTKQYFSKKKAK